MNIFDKYVDDYDIYAGYCTYSMEKHIYIT